MTHAFPGHSAPAAGFEVPLEMLAACHLRVESQCDTLRRLVPHLLTHGADVQAAQAAVAVMRYFDTSARHHHADEEDDLFPALNEAAARSAVEGLHEQTTALTRALAADHRALEQLWTQMRQALQAVAGGDATALAGDEVEAFIAFYAQHIAREEAQLLPLAARLLNDTALDRIGLAMRERRHVHLPGTGP